MKKYRKSIFGAIPIIGSVAIFLFVIAIVLSFFYFFKFQITLVMREQYLWNKAQEVPLNLFSMDIDRESFTSRINKAYYGYENKDELSDKIYNNTIKQLFYFLNKGAKYPFKVTVQVDGITITNVTDVEDCEIEILSCAMLRCTCICSAGCGDSAGKVLGQVWMSETCESAFSISECLYVGVVGYAASYPFPLTFNGTDKLVDKLFYDTVEVK